MPTAVVTGSNSGIGHAFAEILVKEVSLPIKRLMHILDLKQPQGYEVHALDMTVGEKLKNLACRTYQCHLSSDESIQAFAKSFNGKRLDLILNIAGMLHLLSIPAPPPSPSPGSVADAVSVLQAPWLLTSKTAWKPPRTAFSSAPFPPTPSALSSSPKHSSLPSFSPRTPASASCPPASAASRTTAPAVHTPTALPKRPSTASGRAWRWT